MAIFAFFLKAQTINIFRDENSAFKAGSILNIIAPQMHF